ncbi:MAG: hypothetical protein WCK98_03620 [bacterium]
MASKPKTFGERLISIFNWTWLTTFFALLPLLTIVALVLLRPGQNFFSRLLYNLGMVYVLGGFFWLTVKLWEFWNEAYVVYKRIKWKSGPLLQRVFYKVCIPKDFNRKVTEMTNLWKEIWLLNGGQRTKYEIYEEGKWYYDMSFEFIVRNGETELYFTFPFKRTDFVMKVMTQNYPELKFIQCEDPFKSINPDWKPGERIMGKYNNFHAFDFGLTSSPHKSLEVPEKLGTDPGKPSNLMTQLLQSFEAFDKECIFVLQYVIRPFETVFLKDWMEMQQKAKAEEFGRSASFVYTDSITGKKVTATSGDLVTEKQKSTIEKSEKKFKEKHFRVRLKYMLFYPKGKAYYGAITEKFLKVYSQQSATGQMFTKDWFTATDRTFLESKLPLMDAFIGPIMNRIYHEKEVQWRAQCHIGGLLSRDPDVSHDSMDTMLGALEMSTILHFPSNLGVFEEHFQVPKPPQDVQQVETKKEQTATIEVDQRPVSSFSKLSDLRQKALSKQPVSIYSQQSQSAQGVQNNFQQQPLNQYPYNGTANNYYQNKQPPSNLPS